MPMQAPDAHVDLAERLDETIDPHDDPCPSCGGRGFTFGQTGAYPITEAQEEPAERFPCRQCRGTGFRLLAHKGGGAKFWDAIVDDIIQEALGDPSGQLNLMVVDPMELSRLLLACDEACPHDGNRCRFIGTRDGRTWVVDVEVPT
jgi:hypothetical protein